MVPSQKTMKHFLPILKEPASAVLKRYLYETKVRWNEIPTYLSLLNVFTALPTAFDQRLPPRSFVTDMHATKPQEKSGSLHTLYQDPHPPTNSDNHIRVPMYFFLNAQGS